MVDAAEAQTSEDPTAGAPGGRDRRWWYLAALAVVVVVVAIAALVVGGDDGAAPRPGGGPTTAETAPATTEAPGTTTSTTVAPSVDRSTAIWPFAGSGTRFTDPVDAARAFAAEFLGFGSPVVGAFQEGDSRSGEVEVRPVATGPVSTVVVRQLEDDAWYVLAATTPTIEVDEPTAGSAVRSPVTVRGSAVAFEGTVEVEVRQDGNLGPIGEGFVTGGGDELRPFEGVIGFDPPTERLGALVFLSRSAEDGGVWAAAALRVRFEGGEFERASCGGYEPPRPVVGAGEMEVTLTFNCDEAGGDVVAPIPVYRVVPSSTGVLRASLDALLAGPTPEESAAGISSWFSAETAGMLRGVTLADGHAVVDLADLRPVIPNASTSAGSALLLHQLDSTVFRFPSVETVEYRLEGSCERFSEWLQLGGCERRTRG
jgi:hypothetical protein